MAASCTPASIRRLFRRRCQRRNLLIPATNCGPKRSTITRTPTAACRRGRRKLRLLKDQPVGCKRPWRKQNKQPFRPRRALLGTHLAVSSETDDELAGFTRVGNPSARRPRPSPKARFRGNSERRTRPEHAVVAQSTAQAAAPITPLTPAVPTEAMTDTTSFISESDLPAWIRQLAAAEEQRKAQETAAAAAAAVAARYQPAPPRRANIARLVWRGIAGASHQSAPG